VRIAIVEAFVVTVLFAAAIAAVTAVTNRALVKICSGGLKSLVHNSGPVPGSHVELLQPSRWED